MEAFETLPVVINPSEDIVINLEKGGQCSAIISLSNKNEQKILVKIRSTAGKAIRMKHGYLALNAKETISFEIYLQAKCVEEYIQKFREGKQIDSYKLQFNLLYISDIMFDKLTKLSEEDQVSEMTTVWSSARKSDIQQIVKRITFSFQETPIHSDNNPITPKEERISDESMQSFQTMTIMNSAEYQNLKKQYNALCVVFKRCQDVIKSQEKVKSELKTQLDTVEAEANSLRLELQNRPVPTTIPNSTSVRPAVATFITIFAVVAAFVLGFVVGQFATQFLWK